MSEKKEDLRIRRTHKLLCNAMLSLLETNSFDEISVVDICDKAMVHRATFYKHFKDKYEFMAYVTREKLREFYLKSSKKANFSNKKKLYRSMVNTVITFVEDNKQMFKIAANSVSSSQYDSVNKIVNNEMMKFILESEKYGEKYSAPADVVATFLTGGFTNIIRWWVTEENDYSKEDIKMYIENLLLISSESELSNNRK